METLFKAVKEGTPVTLVDQPYKLGTDDGALFLESHPDSPAAKAQRQQILQRVEAWAREKKGRRVNKTLVAQVVAQSSGIPVRVSE